MADGGTVATARKQLGRGLRATVTHTIALSLGTWIFLASFWITGGQLARVGYASFVGVVALFASFAAFHEEDPQSGDSNSRMTEVALAIVLMAYINILVVMGTAFGYAFAQAGYPEMAVSIAIIYPTLDHWISSRGVPAAAFLAGLLVYIIQTVSGLVEDISDSVEFSTALSDARDLLSDQPALYTVFDDAIRRATLRL